MRIECPIINCGRDILVCIYNCKENKDCSSWYHHYDDICNEPIEEKYIEKYGQAFYPIPSLIEKKRKEEEKKAKKQAKIDKKKPKVDWDNCVSLAPKKRGRKPNPDKIVKEKIRTRRSKAEMIEFRKQQELSPVVTEPKKRIRRTKLQIEEDNKKLQLKEVDDKNLKVIRQVETAKEEAKESTLKFGEEKQKRVRRTKQQMMEARVSINNENILLLVKGTLSAFM